jgi:hypothetical protein
LVRLTLRQPLINIVWRLCRILMVSSSHEWTIQPLVTCFTQDNPNNKSNKKA